MIVDLSESEYSDTAQDYISKKISKLSDEGKPHDQAVAIAMSMAKEKGYKVPGKSKNETYSKEDVQEIISRANDLMSEAREKMKHRKR